MNSSSSKASSEQRRRRVAVSYREIVQVLRSEIRAGKFPPGTQLPTNAGLRRRFATTPVTVQRAVHELAREGFIRTRHRHGMFVADRPPHLHRYALVFHVDPTDLEVGGWSHFYAALANEATKINHGGHRQIECFYGVHTPTEAGQYRQLMAKIQTHQFAGIIFASHPGRFKGDPLVEWGDIPRVALTTYERDLPKINGVGFDTAAWFTRALDYLKARGCKRIAFLNKPTTGPFLDLAGAPAKLAARGLITRPHWNIPLPLWTEDARHIVHLLMRNRDELPEALVVTDDNLVESTVAGLMAAGVRVPEDIEVVAHANFPRSGPRLLPLKWLGFDNHAVLQTAIAIIDQQCRGEKSPRETTIFPVFEDELANKQIAMEPSSRR